MRAALLALLMLLAAAPTARAAGLQTNVAFDTPSPLFATAEIVRRLVSPLGVAELQAALARSGKRLPDIPIDLAAERFAIYVPSTRPPAGYGLVVFVPPWSDARLPQGWREALDRQGLIFVTAARSGNDESIFDRRVPLAIAAATNVIARYPIDPTRAYVAGFSGGSRVALRIALGYPDLFRGAVLMAGADPLGEPPNAPPPADLFARFQADSRLVFLTGEDDAINVAAADASLVSLRAFCVFDVRSMESPHMGHEAPQGADFARALMALGPRSDQAPAPDPVRLAACRAGLQRDLAGRLDSVRAHLAKGDLAGARAALTQADRRFGGLAAPQSLDLWRKAGGL